ncbi:tyrosine-type recombinase/integrase (plasmid) [Streptomyces sp. NBC_01450]|uniref:tyrosine-type recombinase/integrase n=1 Tax=Streptomyces sp. NBC_01450 TaxID=2903871 RepID=UPI002E352260|nr:tyrosine-type recombinase/integrase [Streptomyces sp. NBC_01450]
MVVPRVGKVKQILGDPIPYRLFDACGGEVLAVTEFLRDLTASDCSPATLRSYAYELLGWFRFLQALAVSWDRASRAEARDYALWLARVSKTPRPRRQDSPPPGAVNPVTGKRHPAESYAVATRRHARAVIHGFYEYHRAEHGHPLVNPFPAGRGASDAYVNAHHNPLQPWRRPGRPAPYQPKAPKRVPRAIPDECFNQLFAALSCHRDRALLAFWISTGARAEELLGTVRSRVDPADQLIGVIRKGSRALQMLPASADAFVWLRLYQHSLPGEVPEGPDGPLWWTQRRPRRPLSYDAARMMFTRAQQALGSNWSLHDLRHSAAYRMVNDPHMTLVDVQWVLGHAHLSTTELYLTPNPDHVVERLLAHHARQSEAAAAPPRPAPGYRPEVLQALFGTLPSSEETTS